MDTRPGLAIIIPTLNEEGFIGKLLDSIYKQTIKPKEIVVVDAYSKDLTKAEVIKRQAKLPQLKFYQIPKSTVSKQRNLGALQTTANEILFLDADMILKDKNCLEEYFKEVKERDLDAAAATNLPTSNYWKDQVFFTSMNLLYLAIRPLWPMANGMNIYVKRKFFKKIGGFDDSIKIGEDHDFIQRIVRVGAKFKYLKNVSLYTSPRRYQKMGRRKFAIKMIRSFMHVVRHGYKDNPVEIDYEFGKHNS